MHYRRRGFHIMTSEAEKPTKRSFSTRRAFGKALARQHASDLKVLAFSISAFLLTRREGEAEAPC